MELIFHSGFDNGVMVENTVISGADSRLPAGNKNINSWDEAGPLRNGFFLTAENVYRNVGDADRPLFSANPNAFYGIDTVPNPRNPAGSRVLRFAVNAQTRLENGEINPAKNVRLEQATYTRGSMTPYDLREDTTELYMKFDMLIGEDYQQLIDGYEDRIGWMMVAEFWNDINWVKTPGIDDYPYRVSMNLDKAEGLGQPFYMRVNGQFAGPSNNRPVLKPHSGVCPTNFPTCRTLAALQNFSDYAAAAKARHLEKFARAATESRFQDRSIMPVGVPGAWDSLWCDRSTVPMPLGRWFTVEMYYKAGGIRPGDTPSTAAQNDGRGLGRFFMAVTFECGTRHVVSDRVGYVTQSPFRPQGVVTGIQQFNPFKLYAAVPAVQFINELNEKNIVRGNPTNYMLEIFYDNLEYWTTMPDSTATSDLPDVLELGSGGINFAGTLDQVNVHMNLATRLLHSSVSNAGVITVRPKGDGLTGADYTAHYSASSLAAVPSGPCQIQILSSNKVVYSHTVEIVRTPAEPAPGHALGSLRT